MSQAASVRLIALLPALILAALLLTVPACSSSGGSNADDNAATHNNASNDNAAGGNSNSEPTPGITVGLTKVMDVEDAFETPECILHDEMLDVYLVSNIGMDPDPLAVDGDGFISRVSPEGKVLQLRFIDGNADGITLNAPKGMAITGETLWVADISVVRRFNHTNGELIDEIAVPDATFLNDIAADGNGGVFVSDSGYKLVGGTMTKSDNDAIYRIAADGTISTFVKNADLGGPNGLLLAGNELLVVSYVPETPELRRYRMDGSASGLVTLPKGGLDGIVSDGRGGLLISSWQGECLYRLPDRTSSKVETAATGIVSPADLGFDGTRRRVLVPGFLSNMLHIYELTN